MAIKTANDNMFSKIEREYLKDHAVSRKYGYVLEYRIKSKLQQFYRLELPLIQQNPKLTEFHKNLTENNKLRTGSEPATFTLPR